MEKTEIVKKLNQLIAAAKLDDALTTLVSFLDSNAKYSRLEKIARKTQLLFSKTQQDEQKGTISFENAKLNYNIVTDSLLQLIDDIEKDNLKPSRYQIEKDKTKKWQLIVSVITLLVIAGGFALWYFQKNPIPPGTALCPKFDTSSKFNILLLPFDNLDGTNLAPHKQIKKGFANKISEYHLIGKADVDISEKDFGAQNAFTAEEAEKIGKKCAAKLVMWGSAETVDGQKEVTAKYKLIDKSKLDLNLLHIADEAENITRVKRLTSIKADGILTKDVDIIIRAFFGIVAHEMGNDKVAIENLEEVSKTINPENAEDSSALMIVNTVLADSYINEDQAEKAIATYDKVLDVHPNYKLANNNKAILLIDLEKYEEAIPYLNNVIVEEATDSTNINLRKIRAKANFNTDKLEKAKKDYEFIQKVKPDDKKAKEDLKLVKRVIASRKTKIPKNNIAARTANIPELEQATKGNISVGNYREADRNASKILKINPKSFLGYATKIEVALEKGDTAKAKKFLKKAQRVGIKPKEFYKKFPQLKPPIIMKPRVKKSLIIQPVNGN
ncbi:MAG TPA: hypothetical protein ENI82_02075 [Bacteroidetes bacterium]|nr:hypothetical protein [Bacteroidota bacterium]